MARPQAWPALAGIIVFLFLACAVATGTTQGIDVAITHDFTLHRTTIGQTLMQGVSLIGSGWAEMVFAVGAIFALALRPVMRSDAARLLFAIGGEIIINGLKALFHRPRPSPAFAHLGYSFPSGHSFFALTMYGFLAWRLTRADMKPRPWIWPCAALLVLLVGFSRVYVGVHYATDVLGGFAAALPWLWVCLALPLGGKIPARKEFGN